MSIGRLIGGVLCLALAGLLAVLSVALPEGEVVFRMGDTNALWIPVLALVGVGAWLVLTSRRRQGAS